MSSQGLILGIVIFFVVLVVLGLLGRRARKEPTLSDHFLAGRGLGFTVLLLTLFATQYSGNSLSGFPGKTYREGATYFMSVTFMVGIVAGYLLFAPALYRRVRKKKYLTPGDFLLDRWQSKSLHTVSTIIFLFVLMNFLLAQLMAFGHALSGMTQNSVSYATAVIVGATVVVLYEWLGGMRAVAWTDVLQGGLLLLGLGLLAGLLMYETGGPAAVFAEIATRYPEKIAAPDLTGNMRWLSNFALLALGGPLYPQAIQRIYAARSGRTLRNAFAAMSLLPLVAITTVVFIGLVGILWFPDLGRVESDGVTFRVLAELTERIPFAVIPTFIVTLAILAAIMSTADSCLLSLTSIVTKDVIARLLGWSDQQAERRLHWTPWISLLAMGSLVAFAVVPRTTLWGLLVLKFEILIQLSPAFVLGLLHKKDAPEAFRATDIGRGLAAGLATFALLYITDHTSPAGLHAGTLGVLVNYGTCYLSRALRRAQS